MAIHRSAQTGSHPAPPIEGLVRERGLGRFGLFFVTGEGETLPNGDEGRSGYVIDGSGCIFAFWTGWDAARQRLTLTEWERVEEAPEWRGVSEYERARVRAGLSPKG